MAIFDLYQQYSNLRALEAPILSCSFSCARHVVALPLVGCGSDHGLGVDDPHDLRIINTK
jgi:hypothetical protein